eukprot:TRINITY_DN319_c0_g1_i1.p1 TRINITY_DN319_c0_g1~~TRINITY_DN319_c0_g1_i1.p1  ORF type:complete len:259 (+),score=41.70 TRINITY_DN319_c0_g1_i1:119-895(+)
MCIRDRYQRRVRGGRSGMDSSEDGIDFDRIVAEVASESLVVATNACGVLCTLTIASQRARSAVSSSPVVVPNIEIALGAGGDLPHNAALLVSQLATVGSFRLRFVKSKGLQLLVNLLNQSEHEGEQCNVLHALVSLAGAGRDCHSELYASLVKSGVTWKARQLMCSSHPHVHANAQSLADAVRSMGQVLGLSQADSTDAVNALALLSCDTPNGSSRALKFKSSPSNTNKKPRNSKDSAWQEQDDRGPLNALVAVIQNV